MKLRAPAKINLGLRVIGVRNDGYHTLDSIFLPLALADEVEVELRPVGEGVAFTLLGQAGPDVPTGPENLAVRAARVFLEAAGDARGVSVRLTKAVPSAAGLGGGSSDAGAVLRALATLLPDRISQTDLAALALGLGADVPFFLDPRPARVSGIGERIQPLADVPALPILLARRGPGLSTAAVFRAYDAAPERTASLTPGGQDPTLRPLWALLEAGGLDRAGPQLGGLVNNELEPAATALQPAVAEVRREIENSGALVTAMSGSGPTLFGVFEDEARAAVAARTLRERSGADTWVTRTLPSP